jgi:hypothetical protein
MAQYGLFRGNEKVPAQTFEGSSMEQNGDHVYIYQKREGGEGRGPQVAAIKLSEGSCVKEIKGNPLA